MAPNPGDIAMTEELMESLADVIREARRFIQENGDKTVTISVRIVSEDTPYSPDDTFVPTDLFAQ